MSDEQFGDGYRRDGAVERAHARHSQFAPGVGEGGERRQRPIGDGHELNAQVH